MKTIVSIGIIILIASSMSGCMGYGAPVVTVTEIDEWYDVHSIQLHSTGSEWYSIHYTNDANELCMLKLQVDHRPLNDPTTEFQPYPTLHRGIVYHTEGDAKLRIVRRIDEEDKSKYRYHRYYLEVELYVPDKTNIDACDDRYSSGRSTHTATARTLYTKGEQ